jgi:SAM-dependent methyltransferase
MIVDKNPPEINVDQLMQRIREEPSRGSPYAAPSSARVSVSPNTPDLREIAAALGRIVSDVSPPSPIRLSLPEPLGQPMPAPFHTNKEADYHLRDFLAYDGADFVSAAYQAMLQRDVDEDGLNCYLAMLQEGASKVEILGRIHKSLEGKQRRTRVRGLTLPYVLDSISRWPMIGRVVGIAAAIWNLPVAERRNRRLSFELAHRLEQSELYAAQTARSVHEALRTLQHAQNLLSETTTRLAGRTHLSAVQQALTETIGSLQVLQRATANKVDQELLDHRIGEILAQIDKKAEHASLVATNRQIQSVFETKADRAELDRWAGEFAASVGTIKGIKADTEELAQLRIAIAGVAQSVAEIRDSKAESVALQNIHEILLRAMETKTERHEVTALTNHLVALLEHRATKDELQPLYLSLDKASDAIHNLRLSKADSSEFDGLRREVEKEWTIALDRISKAIQDLANTKADQGAIATLRTEFSAALNDSTNAAGAALQVSVSELDRRLDALRHSKAEQAAVTDLRLEVVAAETAIQACMKELERKLGVLDQSKAAQTTFDAFKIEAMGEIEQTRRHWSDRLEQLAAAKTDHLILEAAKSEVAASIEQVRRHWNDRLDQVAVAKADRAIVDTVKREVAASIERNHQSTTEALNTALLSVNSRTQDLKRHVLDQERRVGLLLEETRKRFPATITKKQIRAMRTEDDHHLDAMYASFEDQFRGTRTDIRQKQSIYLPYVRKAKAGTSDAPVLDVGCGRGEWLELLRDEGFIAKGIDINRVFLDGCRELNLDVSEQDALTFLRELKRDSVGVVTSFHMIEHLEQRTLIALLDETFRVLRPGGVAIFETPNPRNLVVGSCNFYLDPTHKRPLPPDLSRYLLEARGFSKIDVLEIHPSGPEVMVSEGAQAVRDALNFILHSSQDYAVLGWKA